MNAYTEIHDPETRHAAATVDHHAAMAIKASLLGLIEALQSFRLEQNDDRRVDLIDHLDCALSESGFDKITEETAEALDGITRSFPTDLWLRNSRVPS